MKIAVTNAFLPSEEHSGVPYQVHHLANALTARGHDVTVFTFSPRPEDATYTVHQFDRPAIPARYLPFVMAFRLAWTDFSSFDVINCHGDNYLLRSRRPIVRTFHGTAIDEMKNAETLRRRIFFAVLIPLERIGALLADHIVGVSQSMRKSMPAVQTVIPCGVDLAAFHAGPKTERPTLLFVGTEGGRKRGAWLAGIFKAHVLPAVPDAELRMVSEAAAIEPGVRRYGRVSTEELAGLYRSSWAFCLPSTYEGFGVPYIEAMAAQTAVVATDPNSGANEVLANGEYGMFVDDAHLAEALTSILSDASLRADLERRGTARSIEYAWNTIAGRYETVFSNAIDAKAGRGQTA
jgi:glycosyltransferase involved in cell wall biosynthesis